MTPSRNWVSSSASTLNLSLNDDMEDYGVVENVECDNIIGWTKIRLSFGKDKSMTWKVKFSSNACGLNLSLSSYKNDVG